MTFFRGLVSRLRSWQVRYQPMLQNRWLRLGLQVIILIFCSVYLIKNLQGIEKPELLLSSNIWLMLAALAGSIFSTFLGGLNWWLVLSALEQKVPLRTAARIHFQANLAKYLPGYFWQIAGKAYMTKQTGPSMRNVGLALFVEMGMIFASGIPVVVLFLPDGIATTLRLQSALLYLSIAAVLLLAAIPFVTRILINQLARSGEMVQIHIRYLIGSAVLVSVNWILLGWYFWMLGNAITPLGFDQLNNFIFVLTTSFLIGFLIVIVPGSFGVREAIIVFLLGPTLTNPVAVLVAILDRALFILSDVIAFLIFKLFERFSKKTS
jgi:uncharacterized membrane protein YbhN (UPF0104 family)